MVPVGYGLIERGVHRRLSLRPLFPGRWQPQYLVFTDGRAGDEGARLSQDRIRV